MSRGNQQNRAIPMHERYGASSGNVVKMNGKKKFFISFTGLFPSVMLFFYSTGMWTPKNDSLDNIMTASAIFCGLALTAIVTIFLGDGDD